MFMLYEMAVGLFCFPRYLDICSQKQQKTCHNQQTISNLKLILPLRSHDLWLTHDKAKAKQMLELENRPY